MFFMKKINEHEKILLGYSLIALKRLGYSEKIIREFLIEIDLLKRTKTDEDAIEAIDAINNTINKTSHDTNIQVIFERIIIPAKYNMIKISDLFEKHDFMGKQYNYIGNKICGALSKSDIMYIKDLHGKTKNDIMYIHAIGKVSYDFFIQALMEIFHSE